MPEVPRWNQICTSLRNGLFELSLNTERKRKAYFKTFKVNSNQYKAFWAQENFGSETMPLGLLCLVHRRRKHIPLPVRPAPSRSCPLAALWGAVTHSTPQPSPCTPRDTWHCCCAPRGPTSTALLLNGCCSPREEAGRISAMAAVLDVMGRVKSRSPWNAAAEESRNFGSATSTPSPSCQVSLQREHLSSIICTLEEAQTYRQQ